MDPKESIPLPLAVWVIPEASLRDAAPKLYKALYALVHGDMSKAAWDAGREALMAAEGVYDAT